MRWIGKALGAAFGYLAAGPFGALLGAFVGHLFDRGLAQHFVGASGAAAQIQAAFFRATFTVMGYVCKADGRISEAEIAIAEHVMAQMALSAEQRRQAIAYFNQGKQPGFALDAVLEQFRTLCRWQPNLFRFFLEVQLQAAFADGKLDQVERELLLHVADRLGLSPHEYARLESLLRGEQHQRQARGSRTDSLTAAYEILGVSKDALDSEVKKAYRRLMNQHHPDKLVAKGLPEEMMKMAKEKTQEIRAAYDTIKQARGMR